MELGKEVTFCYGSAFGRLVEILSRRPVNRQYKNNNTLGDIHDDTDSDDDKLKLSSQNRSDREWVHAEIPLIFWLDYSMCLHKMNM